MSNLPAALQRPLVFGDLQQIEAVRQLESENFENRQWIVEVTMTAEFTVWGQSDGEAIEHARAAAAIAGIHDFDVDYVAIDQQKEVA